MTAAPIPILYWHPCLGYQSNSENNDGRAPHFLRVLTEWTLYFDSCSSFAGLLVPYNSLPLAQGSQSEERLSMLTIRCVNTDG